MAHSPGVGLIKAGAVHSASTKGGVVDEPPVFVVTGAARETQSKQIIKLNDGCKAAAPAKERAAWDQLCLCVHLFVCDCVFADHELEDRKTCAHEMESAPRQP